MNKTEKLASMKSYVANLEARLTAPVPQKREKHPEAYRAYLRLELKKAQKTVDKLVSEGAGSTK